MKELGKTKYILISAVLLLLVVFISVLTFKKPQQLFKKNASETLKEISNQNYILTQSALATMDASQYMIIDIRSHYEYAKSHLKGAVNMPIPDILNENSNELLDQIKEKGQLAVLYGQNPDLANSAWMLLYQLGYENIKILNIETDFIDNQFHVKNIDIEKPYSNYALVMEKAKEKKPIVKKAEKKVIKKATTPKKVIPVKKKKKRMPEGGC